MRYVSSCSRKNSYHVCIIVSNSIGMLTSYSKHTICKDFTVVLKHHKFSKCFAFHVVTVRFKISLWTYTDLIMSLKHLHSTKMRGFITGHCIFSEGKIMMKKRTQGPVCSEMPSESEEGRRSLSSLKLSVTLSHVSGLISLMFCFCTF